MTRDDVLNLAREAGFRTGNIVLSFGDPLPFVAPLSATNCIVELEKFAALVAAAEREACAKVCEGRIGGATKEDTWWSGFRSAMSQCADVIRARGKK